RYTRMGAIPAMVFMLLARPLPANTRRPAASCTSTHESAEKLRRRRALPTPAVASASAGVACAGGAPETGTAAAGGGANAAGLMEGGAAAAAFESFAAPADAALGFPATVTPAGAAPCRCHGFH